MTIDDQLHHEQNELARAELRRIISEHKPPSSTPLEAFGPWAAYLDPLRQAFAERGLKAAQEVFIAFVRLYPHLALLLHKDGVHPAVQRPTSVAPAQSKAGWTMDELLAASFPHAGWIVPGLLPMGLSTLAGRPKMGKSWLALQIACAVGAGGAVLDRAVEQGPVLYLALEDGPRRLQERLQKQGAARGDVTFALEWQPLGSSGLDALRSVIDRQKYRLVIVDTLSRALGRTEQLELAAMTLTIRALQRLTRDTGAAILMVDHHKKPIRSLANPIDDILGSTGKAAIVDAALGIYRERGKADATLHATGRDMQQIELYVRWDAEHCTWQAAGEAVEVRRESLRGAILAAIRELNELGEVSSTTAIARHLDKDKSNVSHELAGLIEAGKVVKGRRDGRVVPYLLVE